MAAHSIEALYDTDPVSAFSFCAVHRLVHPDERHFGVGVRRLYLRYSQADRQRNHGVLEVKASPVDPEPDILCYSLRIGRTASRKDHNQLLPPIACEKISLTQGKPHDARYFLETLVACPMSKLIVDGFEAVHVYKNQAENLSYAVIGFKRIAYLQFIGAAVMDFHERESSRTSFSSASARSFT